MSTFRITDSAQASLLADTFKRTLLEQFSGEAMTTKQVADALGEKAPKLYRHVDALVAAGLLTLVREQPKRGTVERYYQTIASRFEVDPDLFSLSKDDEDDTLRLVRQVFRNTENDIVALQQLPEAQNIEEALAPIILNINLKASAAQVADLRGRLLSWVEECEALPDTTEETLAYRGLISFYPSPD